MQILYISNLVPGQLSLPSENSEYVPNGEAGLGCEIQTWYLANDMQLFLLTPIVAILHRKRRAHAYAFIAAILCGPATRPLCALRCALCSDDGPLRCRVLMHAYIIFALSHWGMTNCDQLVYGKGGGGHVVPNDPNSPLRGTAHSSKKE